MSSKRAAARAVGTHYVGDLRTVLVAAAAERVAVVGTEALSLRDVARRVGVSHAAPTHHFGDKAGLLTAVATHGFRLFIDHMAEAIGSADAGPEDLLVAMAEAYAQFADLHAGYFDVMFRPALFDVDDVEYLDASQAAFDSLRGVIVHCQSLGWHTDGDPDVLSLAAWSFAHGMGALLARGAMQRHNRGGATISTIAGALIARHPGGDTT